MIAATAWQLLFEKDAQAHVDTKNREIAGCMNGDDEGLSGKIFYPFTFPVTAGPGTLVVMLTLSAHASENDLTGKLAAHVGIALAAVALSAMVYLCYAYAPKVTSAISPSSTHGISASSRLFCCVSAYRLPGKELRSWAQASSCTGEAMQIEYPIGRSYDSMVASHLKLLNALVRRRVRRPEDAEDIIQETLLLALRHFDQFRFEASFSTWLYRIAINVIRGRVRRPHHRRLVCMDPTILERISEPDPRTSQLAALEKGETFDRLYRALARLPKDYRIVVELRDIKGLSIKQTAETLVVPDSTVKSRHYRARLRLLSAFQNGST